jgi:MerR family mercuric resistance operon transcriptional regulator
VHFIKAAQTIGFTLDEIAQQLRLEDGTQCSQAREIASSKLADVGRRMLDLQRIEAPSPNWSNVALAAGAG